jgi:hypothetical protein
MHVWMDVFLCFSPTGSGQGLSFCAQCGCALGRGQVLKKNRDEEMDHLNTANAEGASQVWVGELGCVAV